MNSNSANDIRLFAVYLSKLSPTELSILASAAGILLSQGLTTAQIGSLGNFLEAIGQLMVAYGAQQHLLDEYRKDGL